MKLSRQEQEATVYTHNKALQKRLDGFCAENPRCTLEKMDESAKTYKVPKKYVCVRRTPVYTEETRAKMANKAREVFHQKEKALIQPTI